jgi:lipoyl(octanoyl) transferase
MTTYKNNTLPILNLLEWRISGTFVDYPTALAEMEQRVKGLLNNQLRELVWLLEHPPLYTAGTSASPEELLDHMNLPVYTSDRGGRFTYHGPGQRVAYIIINLSKRRLSISAYRFRLEEWLIKTLAHFNIRGERRAGRVGIWVDHGNGCEDKIAAVGIHVRRWVTSHGIALNVNPDLSHFTGIVPCGLSSFGVTSLAELGLSLSLTDVDSSMRKAWLEVFEG